MLDRSTSNTPDYINTRNVTQRSNNKILNISMMIYKIKETPMIQ